MVLVWVVEVSGARVCVTDSELRQTLRGGVGGKLLGPKGRTRKCAVGLRRDHLEFSSWIKAPDDVASRPFILREVNVLLFRIILEQLLLVRLRVLQLHNLEAISALRRRLQVQTNRVEVVYGLGLDGRARGSQLVSCLIRPPVPHLLATGDGGTFHGLLGVPCVLFLRVRTLCRASQSSREQI